MGILKFNLISQKVTFDPVWLEIFHQNYQLICNNDFEFVRREKISVSPSVCKDVCWNYDAIKALIGQGKLCCRLLTNVSGITPKRSKAEEDINEYKR